MDLELAAFILLLGAVVHLTIEVRRIKREVHGRVRGHAKDLPAWAWPVVLRRLQQRGEGK